MHPPQESQAGSQESLKSRSKTRGNLAATLDPQLRPRRSPGQIGRPKGSPNFEWTPEIDRLLVELCAERSAAAKRVVGKALLQARRATSVPSADSIRKAVERRIATLGIVTEERRRVPEGRVMKRWTEAQTAALRRRCHNRVHRPSHRPQCQSGPCEDRAAGLSDQRGTWLCGFHGCRAVGPPSRNRAATAAMEGMWLAGNEGQKDYREMPGPISPGTFGSGSIRWTATRGPDLPSRPWLPAA